MLYSFLSIYPFMVCLFWTAVFTLEWREANPPKHVLTLFMGTCTILYLCHALFFNGLATTATNSIYDFCNIAVFPLYLIYIYRLTDSRPLSRRHLLLLTPALIVGLSGFYTPPTLYNPRGVITRGIFIIQLLSVCLIGIRRLRNFDLQIENFFSNTEQRSVKHTRNMIAALLICSCCSAIASILGREHFLDNPSLLLIPSLLFGSLLFVVGYVGQKQVFCADSLEDIEKPESYKENVCATGTSHLLASLDEMMMSSRLYLQADLRLSDVATRLNVSRTTLSVTINQNANVSFSDYINSFRIRHAQKIMRTNTQLSVIQIAEQSGFTSESSFYRAFRKHTGMTPKQWTAQAT